MTHDFQCVCVHMSLNMKYIIVLILLNQPVLTFHVLNLEALTEAFSVIACMLNDPFGYTILILSFLTNENHISLAQ